MEWNALEIRTTIKRALFGVKGECGVVAGLQESIRGGLITTIPAEIL